MTPSDISSMFLAPKMRCFQPKHDFFLTKHLFLSQPNPSISTLLWQDSTCLTWWYSSCNMKKLKCGFAETYFADIYSCNWLTVFFMTTTKKPMKALPWMTCSFIVVYLELIPNVSVLRQHCVTKTATQCEHMSCPQGALHIDCEYMWPINCLTVFQTHILKLILGLQLNTVPNQRNIYSCLLKP